MSKITSLTIYPIKSCRGCSVEAAAISDVGNFCYDRHWVIVNAGTGKFITQRQMGSLALVQPTLPKDAFLGELDTSSDDPTNCMLLQAPGQPDFSLPLHLPEKLNLVDTTVWAWTGKAHDEGDAVAAWFSTYLGKQVRLVRFIGDSSDPNHPGNRPVDPDGLWTPPLYSTMFSDQFPFLIANESSLEDLNKQVADENTSEQQAPQILMNRFRPNIVVAGPDLKPWSEDTWTKIKITGESSTSSVEIDLVKPCSRCKVPTIDQSTGVDGLEPTMTMMKTRSGVALNWTDPPEFKGTVFFGTNGVLPDKSSKGRVIAVGDSVKVLQVLNGPWVPLKHSTR